MNRKTLIQRMVAIAATAAVCGIANAAAPQQTGDTTPAAASERDVTRNAWLDRKSVV